MQTADAVLQYLSTRAWSTAPPLFLGVGFHKPHIPLKFPAQYLDLIPPEEEIGLAADPGVSAWMRSSPGAVAFQPFADVRSRQDVQALGVPFPYGRMPDSFARKVRRAYLGAVAYMDAQLGPSNPVFPQSPNPPGFPVLASTCSSLPLLFGCCNVA